MTNTRNAFDTLADRIRSEAAQAAWPGQMERLEGIAEEVVRLRRAAADLGKNLQFWMDLAVAATGSQDCIEDDGDGDWGVVAERLAELGDEVKRLRTAVPTPEAHARQIARAEAAERALRGRDE